MKMYIFYCIEHRKKKLAACFLYNIDIVLVSECLCHLRGQYPVQSPDIYINRFYILSTKGQ